MQKDFIINNIGIDEEEYRINDYFLLKQDIEDKNKTWVYTEGDDSDHFYDNDILLFDSLLLSIPKVHISISSRKKEPTERDFAYNLYKDRIDFLNSNMFNFYFDINGDFDYSYFTIGKHHINIIRHVLDIVIQHSKICKQERDNNTWIADRWFIAYNHFNSAYKSISVELSIQNMITALEALLVEGSGELNFRVALYSSLIVESDPEKRKEVSKLVKYMYDIRSKSVHGEIMSAHKKLKNFDYTKYYRFKEITSEVLVKTFGKKEDEIFNALDNMIYSPRDFKYYIT